MQDSISMTGELASCNSNCVLQTRVVSTDPIGFHFWKLHESASFANCFVTYCLLKLVNCFSGQVTEPGLGSVWVQSSEEKHPPLPSGRMCGSMMSFKPMYAYGSVPQTMMISRWSCQAIPVGSLGQSQGRRLVALI